MRCVEGLRMRSLNHVSLVCSDCEASCAFYRNVLGFTEVKRPAAFDFDSCWLFRSGLGLHLIGGEPVARPKKIDPMSDHFSFQSDDVEEVISALEEMEIEHVRQTLQEGGVTIIQVFFHDPDHNMIEVCNCDSLPIEQIPSDDSSVSDSCS